MASLENILAYDKLFPFFTDEQKKSIAEAIGLSLEEYEHRMGGVTKQNEFILILLFFNLCKNLSGFDESISKLGEKTYTSDLILELKDGMKCLLEIKHTDEDEYSISGGNLRNRIEYANSLNLGLYFAISIRGFWMMFSSDYLSEKHGKITINDYINSIFDEVLDTYAYVFPPGIMIKSVYSKKTNKGLGIDYKPYGELVSYELYYNSKKLLGISDKESPYYVFMLLLEALQDRLSGIKHEINNSDESTIVLDMNDGKCISYIPEYEFLLSPIMHIKESPDEKRDASTVINELKDDKEVPNIPKEKYRGMIQKLVDWGIPIMYVRKGVIYKIPGSEEIKCAELD